MISQEVLPRVTELFEARNPSDPAVVSEIDGVVSFARKLKEVTVKLLSLQKLVKKNIILFRLPNKYLLRKTTMYRAGTPLSDGAVTPADILAIKGPTKVQEYLVMKFRKFTVCRV